MRDPALKYGKNLSEWARQRFFEKEAIRRLLPLGGGTKLV